MAEKVSKAVGIAAVDAGPTAGAGSQAAAASGAAAPTSATPTYVAPTPADRAAAAIDALYQGDKASQALGMRVIETGAGRASVRMTVREDMLNGHRLCHGGIIFVLADSAFAFACNSHGDSALAAAASIDFLLPARGGDVLTASAVETWRAGRSGITEVTVTNQNGERVALFRGRSAVVRK